MIKECLPDVLGRFDMSQDIFFFCKVLCPFQDYLSHMEKSQSVDGAKKLDKSFIINCPKMGRKKLTIEKILSKNNFE